MSLKNTFRLKYYKINKTITHLRDKNYAKSCFINSRLKASKDAARLYVSGKELSEDEGRMKDE